MGFASYAELKAAVMGITLRTGDAIFDADFSRQVMFAEQRINFGALPPLPSEPLRVRGMEETVKINVVAGVATLPADYLAPKRLTFDSDVAVPLKYRTPQDFWDHYLTGGYGIPQTFTVEGNTLTVSPSASGSLTFTYFKKFQAIETEDTVTDRTGSAIILRDSTTLTQRTTAQSNWLMENAPSVVMTAVLIESWKFLRNSQKAQEAYADFVAQSGGLNLTEAKARTPTTLAPRIRGAMIR